MSTRKAVLKVIILGDTGVGKTSIANRYVNNTFTNTYKATIGADIFQKSLYIEDTQIFLTIWDTAGQERFQSLGPGYFRGADACILVYDTTNAKSFESLKRWRSEFIQTARPDQPDIFPFLVLGNKSDLHNKRQNRREDVDGWCKEFKMVNFETSALNGNKVQDAFLELARITLNSQEPNLPVYDVERMKAGLYAIDNPPPSPEPPQEVALPEPQRIYIEPLEPDYAYGLQNCCGYSINLSVDDVRRRRRRERRRRRNRDRLDQSAPQRQRSDPSEGGRGRNRRADSQSSEDEEANSRRRRRQAIEGEESPAESENEGLSSRRRRRKRAR